LGAGIERSKPNEALLGTERTKFRRMKHLVGWWVLKGGEGGRTSLFPQAIQRGRWQKSPTKKTPAVLQKSVRQKRKEINLRGLGFKIVLLRVRGEKIRLY